MHGGAQRQHDVGHIFADAGFLRHFHVGGNGRHGGAGAKGHRCRAKQLGEHQLCAALTAAEPGIEGEEDEQVGKAHDVIDDKRAAVILYQLRAVHRYQIGKEAEETDGSVVGDDLHCFHDAVGDVLQQLGGPGLGTTGHLDAEAKQDGRHDQGQNGPAAQQFTEVRLGKEVDDHIAEAQHFADLALHNGILAVHQRDKTADDVGQHTGDSGSDQEGRYGDAHDLAGPLDTFHVGDGGGDGAEHHGHHHAEHQIDEQRAQEFDLSAEARRQPAYETAGHNAAQHAQDKPVIFQKFLHVSPPQSLTR